MPGAFLRDGHVAAAAVVSPAVIAAHVELLPPLPEGADHRAAVPTGVEEPAQTAILVPGQQHGLPADIGGQEVMRAAELGFEPDVVPRALEDVAHLRLIDLRVREHAAVDLEDPVGRPVVD